MRLHVHSGIYISELESVGFVNFYCTVLFQNDNVLNACMSFTGTAFNMMLMI